MINGAISSVSKSPNSVWTSKKAIAGTVGSRYRAPLHLIADSCTAIECEFWGQLQEFKRRIEITLSVLQSWHIRSDIRSWIYIAVNAASWDMCARNLMCKQSIRVWLRINEDVFFPRDKCSVVVIETQLVSILYSYRRVFQSLAELKSMSSVLISVLRKRDVCRSNQVGLFVEQF